MILDSKNVEYEIIDITEPGKELEKEFMQSNSNARTNKYPLPPQIFNEDDYCGVIIFCFFYSRLVNSHCVIFLGSMH